MDLLIATIVISILLVAVGVLIYKWNEAILIADYYEGVTELYRHYYETQKQEVLEEYEETLHDIFNN